MWIRAKSPLTQKLFPGTKAQAWYKFCPWTYRMPSSPFGLSKKPPTPCATSGASRSLLTMATAMMTNKTERLSLLLGTGDSWRTEECWKRLIDQWGWGEPHPLFLQDWAILSISRECHEVVFQWRHSTHRSFWGWANHDNLSVNLSKVTGSYFLP